MRIGVIGCGYWGSKHVRVLHGLDQVDQVAVVDRDDQRCQELVSQFPGSVSYPDLDAAIDNVDAVVVATPPRTHAPLAKQALEAGKHVLIEKPMATSVAEAEELIELAEHKQLQLIPGHTFEFNAAVWRLREAVQSGELGQIHHIDSARLNLGLYQSDVNVIWDLAPHDISILNYILGATPETVAVWASSHAHQLADVASLRLTYGSGVSATIRVSWLDPAKIRKTTVVGSEKMAVYDDVNDAERLKIFDKGVKPNDNGPLHAMPVSYRYGDVVAPFVDFQEPLAAEGRFFVNSIVTGSFDRAHAQRGLAVVQILEAADRAMEEDRTVHLSDDDKVDDSIFAWRPE